MTGTFELVGSRAVVVGGGRGMGRETVLCLAHAGAEVILVDSDGDRAGSVVDELTELGLRGSAIVTDIREATSADRVIAESLSRMGGVDICVDIVGGASWSDLVDASDDTWSNDFALNLDQVFRLFRATARQLIERGSPGALVAISSMSGIVSAPHHGAYGAAKAGLIHLCRTFAVELGPHRIRVNTVAPGMILTPRAAEMLQSPAAGQRDDWIEHAKTIPLGRMGDPSEIARVVTFLCSDQASYVTGQTLLVDGATVTASGRFDGQ